MRVSGSAPELCVHVARHLSCACALLGTGATRWPRAPPREDPRHAHCPANRPHKGRTPYEILAAKFGARSAACRLFAEMLRARGFGHCVTPQANNQLAEKQPVEPETATAGQGGRGGGGSKAQASKAQATTRKVMPTPPEC